MRKIIITTAIAALMAVPVFASTPESMFTGSSSSVYGSGGEGTKNAYAGSSSNIGIQNDHFTSWNTDATTTNIKPVDGNNTYVHDVSNTSTTTTGTAALEGGGTQSFGGEFGGASFGASGYENGSLSIDPNKGFDGSDHHHNSGD